jgi:hypothetical protein
MGVTKSPRFTSGHCVANVWPLCGHCVATVWPLSAGHAPCEINAPALEEASGPKFGAELVRPALISGRN